MKKYISSLKMMSKETFFKIIIVFVFMIISQMILIVKDAKDLFIRNNNPAAISRFDIFISNSIPFMIIFGIAFLIITGILICVPNYHSNRKQFMFEDLNISEKGIFSCRMIYNCCCYIMLMGIEILIIALSVFLFYKSQNIVSIDNQTLMLSFYRSRFLHALIPLWDLPVYFRNALLIIGLSSAASIYTSKNRFNKANYQIFVLVPLALVLFPVNTDSMTSTLVLGTVSIFIIIRSIYLIIKEKSVLPE